MISRKLKPLSQIIEETGGADDWEIAASSLYCKKRGWCINSNMKPKFGKPYEYTFYPYSHRNYTHRCNEDDYVYHESWFMDNQLEIKLEPELFEL